MLTFLHAADLHLDSPFSALSPEQAAERRDEARQLLPRLAQTARDARADLIFLCGDIFDSRRVWPETIQILYQTLEEIEAEVFVAPGNHDPYGKDSPYRKLAWPRHVHIFTSPIPQLVRLPSLGVEVYGSAFLSAYRMDSPLEGFRAADRGMVRFGCFHGDLSAPNSRYGPISQQQIADSDLDYLALGHVHKASGLQKAGKTWYAWPGCPEGRGFDETGEKGVYLGRIDERQVGLEFIPLAKRRYLTHQLDISGRDPVLVLKDLMADGDPADIVRITLMGERDPEDEPELTALTALASSYFYSAGLRDETSLSRHIWKRAEEDTLAGIFLSIMAQRLEKASREERMVMERAVRFGLAALEGREEPR